MKKSLLILGFAFICNFADAAEKVVQNPDLSLRDLKTDPCDNFYQYACGTWIQKTKIPADKPAWSRSFSVITEQNQLTLKQILENYSNSKFTPENPYAKKLGDFYASCMDEASIEKNAVVQLKNEMIRIEKLSKENLAEVVAWMHLRDMKALFAFGSAQDFKNPEQTIGYVTQGGMGLPAKNYYTDPAEAMIEIRKKYVEHLKKMLVLSGEKAKTAAEQAEKVLQFETKLANAALLPAEMRDPTKLYHRMDRATLNQLSPEFKWVDYLKFISLGEADAFNVAVPGFIKNLNDVLKTTPLDDLKAYLRLKILESSAKGLPTRFYAQNFDFYSKTLHGTEKMPVRWKRCVDATNEFMGFALGRSFVDLKFRGASKDVAKTMIEKVQAAQGKIIDAAEWMDPKTKEGAHSKLRSLVNQIGYPEKWRSYDTLEIQKKSYLENRYSGSQFENLYDLSKIGKPLDRTDWSMSPPEVNAYYHPLMTKMVFPAGILQPPFFRADYSSAANYGGIGLVMGHEISHGFDDSGRKFDAKGSMTDWWTPKTAEAFQKRTQCLIEQYDAYPTVDNGHVNGKLTLGENIGDQGGLKTSYMAWKESLPKETLENTAALQEQERQFFLSFAQTWCSKERDALEKVRVNTDPHPPSRYRVNGAVTNFPAFAKAFQCQAGAKMAPKNQCAVW